MILYNCKASLDRDDSFVVTKFDADMNIESSYLTSLSECECPAGVRPTCRHRQMLPHFIASGRADSEWFFCYDDQSWHRPFEGIDEEPEPSVANLAGERYATATEPAPLKRRV